jgi:UDP-galactopyranose mutase
MNFFSEKLSPQDENILAVEISCHYESDIKNYDIHLKETQECFKKIKNFYSIGRQGQFYYGDIDQMIRIGFDTADKIIKQ